MKSTYKNLLIVLILGLTFFSCEKEDKFPKPPEGAYFSCKVNGEEFDYQGTMFCSPFVWMYYPDSMPGSTIQGYLVFGAQRCDSFNGVKIRMNNFQPQEGYLDMLNPSFADSCFPYYGYLGNDGQPIVFEKLMSGYVNFEKISPRNKLAVAEGTFEFTVTNEDASDTIEVTDGKFKYGVQVSW